jgi:hypothetical protein
MPASGRWLGVLHTGELHVWRVEARRQVAGDGWDSIRRWAVAIGTLSEHASSTGGLSGGYCSIGRAQFDAHSIFQLFKLCSISKYIMKVILMSKIIKTGHGARVDPSKQLLSLGPLPILNRIQVIKLGTTPL